jgi:hypothetical protein
VNPASGPSAKPLLLHGQPQDDDWMGLSWSVPVALDSEGLQSVPRKNGLYKLVGVSSQVLLYVGESKLLRDRLRAHVSKSWRGHEPLASYHVLDDGTPDHQRRELESDLLGAYYAEYGETPVYQYGGSGLADR